MQQVKEYFRNELRHYENIVLRQVHMDLLDCKNRVTRDLIIGQLQINQQSEFIQKPVQLEKDEQLISKRLLMQKQIINLKRKDFQSEEEYKRAKQQIIIQRQEEIKAQKNQKQRKVKQVQERVKSWSLEQKQLNKKRQKKLQQQQRMRQLQQENQKQRKEFAKKQQIQEKKKLIEERIRIIEENKMKREQFNKISKSQSLDKPPLYLEIEKRYNQLQEQKKFEQKIQKKNHLISMKINYDSLKQHQKNVVSKMDERKKKLEQERAKFENQTQKDEFNVFSNKSIQQTKQQAEKNKRRWKYLQTIKQIPISIDESKKLKIQIQVDKSKNPFKYKFLSQKALNQFQIFGQFQNFSFKSDPKQLGDQYLQQSKKLVKLPSVQRSKSVEMINQSRMTQKPQYRNYLAEMKSKRPETQSRATKQGEQDEIQKLLRLKDKKKAMQQLSYRSKQLEMNAMKKIQQLKKMDPQDIKNFMRKESEIDNDFAKAIKARIAALQISN